VIDKALFSLKGVRPVLVGLVVLCVAQALATIGCAYFLAVTLTDLFNGGEVVFKTPTLGAFLGMFLLARLLETVTDAFVDRYAVSCADELQRTLLDSAFSDGAVSNDMGSASFTVSAIEGVSQIENYLHVVLPKIIGMAAIPLPLLVAVTVNDWVSGIILIMMFPVIILFMVLIGRNAASRAADQYQRYHALSNHFVDTLRGLPTLKALGASKRGADEIYESSEDFREATMKTIGYATLSSGVLDLIATLGIAAVAMMLGLRLLDGSIELFTGLFVLYLAPEYFKPIRAFAADFHASQDGKNALAAVNAAIEKSARLQAIGEVEIAPWEEESTLSFVDVSFSYPDVAHDALTGITFAVKGNANIGIIGESGAGKSTLAHLIAGFSSPSSGRIVVNGQELVTLYQRNWRSQVLYIPQSPYIFAATLRENVRFYTPDADDASILEALERVGLGELVAELPDGLDTVLGQSGRTLSGGQAHRIAFARALIDKSRRVLVFDEPTAHLDIETELELKQRLLGIFADRLVVFATHRLHWLDSMDQVVVLDKGCLKAAGAPSEVAEAIRGIANLEAVEAEGGAR